MLELAILPDHLLRGVACAAADAAQVTGPDFSLGFGILGQAGKAGWPIARRGIAVDMSKRDIRKGSVNLFPDEQVAQGWTTLDNQPKQGGQLRRS